MNCSRSANITKAELHISYFSLVFTMNWACSTVGVTRNAFRILVYTPHGKESRDSSVGIALGYRLDERGSRVRFLAEAGNFSLHHRIQNGSGTHSASNKMGTRGSFPGGKAAGAWSWPLTSIWYRGQRMSGAIHPLPQYAFMAWCLAKAQGQLYLSTFYTSREETIWEGEW
jgi:hypothetical protein